MAIGVACVAVAGCAQGEDWVYDTAIEWDAPWDSAADSAMEAPVDSSLDVLPDTPVDVPIDSIPDTLPDLPPDTIPDWTTADTWIDTWPDTWADTPIDTWIDTWPDTWADTPIDTWIDTWPDTALDTADTPDLAGSRILLYYDDCSALDNITPALTNLGLSPTTTVVTDSFAFDAAMTTGTWDLVILDVYGNWVEMTSMDLLAAYYDAGGRIIYASWEAMRYASHGLFVRAGVTFSSEYGSVMPVYRWVDAIIFSVPNSLPDITMMSDYCGTDGQYAEPTTGTAVAGYTMTPSSYQSAIIIDPAGRMIYHSFTPQDVTGDADFDGRNDMVELYENEIDLLL